MQAQQGEGLHAAGKLHTLYGHMYQRLALNCYLIVGCCIFKRLCMTHEVVWGCCCASTSSLEPDVL